MQHSTTKLITEPAQAAVTGILDGYDSAKIVGDVDNAMFLAAM